MLPAFKTTIRRVVSNRVLIYSVMGDFFSILAMMGLLFWLPKYLEHQFRVDKSTSNLYTGDKSSNILIIFFKLNSTNYINFLVVVLFWTK